MSLGLIYHGVDLSKPVVLTDSSRQRPDHFLISDANKGTSILAKGVSCVLRSFVTKEVFVRDHFIIVSVRFAISIGPVISSLFSSVAYPSEPLFPDREITRR